MDLQEALLTALDLEHKIRDHYAESARQATDPKGKHIFAILAREEQNHAEYLQDRLNDLKTLGVLRDEPLTSLLPSPEWLKEEAAKLAQHVQAGLAPKAELDFLKEALELERRTSGFYAEMARDMDYAHRKFFQRFLDIEDGHLSLVQAEIDALAGHGHWFDVKEFDLEM